MVVEFVLISFWKAFFLFLDSRLVDASMWATVLPGSPPTATGRVDVPVFTSAARVLTHKLGVMLDQPLTRAFARFRFQLPSARREAVLIFQARRRPKEDAYALQY